VANRRRNEVARARLDRTRAALDTATRAAESARSELASIGKQRSMFESQLSRIKVNPNPDPNLTYSRIPRENPSPN